MTVSYFKQCLFVLGVTFGVGIFAQPSSAKLGYSIDRFGDGGTYIVVAGQFEYTDNLDEFLLMVAQHKSTLVTFASNGGNVVKAMELGRLIRRLGLSTFQARGLECTSACALAFVGGVKRLAEAGSIGVHKTSFSDTSKMTAAEAVAAIQSITAFTAAYLKEMDVDPEFLHLSMRYEADDIRFLSKSEMVALRVTNLDVPPSTSASPQPQSAAPGPYANLPSAPPALEKNPFAMPAALSGRVRHPRGAVALKQNPDEKAGDLPRIQNGTVVTIISNDNFWYGVRTPVGTGYLHHTWVMVDQFERGAFDDRYVQIKSFQTYEDAQAYARSFRYRSAVYLSTTGWFAVVLDGRHTPERAGELIVSLRGARHIPDDSFITYGNSYVKRVCCN
jgi:hypothetical protein